MKGGTYMDESAIKKAILEKENLISQLEREVIELRQLLLSIKTGLNEGDIVINHKGEKGVICYNGNETCWWGVRKLKKDGTPSSVIQNAYSDWKKEAE